MTTHKATDVEQLAHAELQRLQKQLRSLQLQLLNLNDLKTKELKKQNRMITILQREHQRLSDNVHNIENGPHAKQNFIKERQLSELQEQLKDSRHILLQEQHSLRELETHIIKIRKECDRMRCFELPEQNYKDNLSKAERHVIKLENRLDVVNKKFGDVLTDNAYLRESINHLLQDRSNFNEMWNLKITEYDTGKKTIMELIDQSSLAFDQREELSNKLQLLTERNENDEIVHMQEMRTIHQRLEYDDRLLKFYDIKAKKRTNVELAQRELNKRQNRKEASEQRLAEYKKLIEEMQKLCDEKDVNLLAECYKQQEEENFALFNYVNELSHEVETLQKACQDLTNNIKQQKDELEDKERQQQTESWEHLNAELEKGKLANIQSIEELRISNIALSGLLEGISDIFQQLSCYDTAIMQMLSEKTIPTAYNVKLFIDVIKKRLCEILSPVKESLVPTIATKDKSPLSSGTKRDRTFTSNVKVIDKMN